MQDGKEYLTLFELASAHLLGRLIQTGAQDPLFKEASEKLNGILNTNPLGLMRKKGRIPVDESDTLALQRFEILLGYLSGVYQ